MIPNLGIRISSGTARTVYAIPGYDAVLKVNNRGGESWAGGCASEAAYWSNASGHVRAMLAPILLVDASDTPSWLVMARCRPVNRSLTERTCLSHLAFLLDQEGVQDMHSANVGYLGETLVAIDYAFNGFRRPGCGCDTAEGCDCAPVSCERPTSCPCSECEGKYLQ